MLFERIITIGLNPTIDRLIDTPGLRIGEHVKGRVRSRMPAGKAFNVSRAMAALGVSSVAMGFLGRESIELFDHAAGLAGIETDWTPIAARTRENLTLVDPVGGTATHIRDAGPTIEPMDLDRLSDQLSQACRAGTLAVFCGSLPPGLRASDFAELLSACIRRGGRVAVDTSGDALRAAAELELWLIKPNREELQELTGTPIRTEVELISATRDLGRRFPVSVVTLGGDGSIGIHGQEAWRVRLSLPADMIRSTVGCGDTFLAGLLASLQQGASMDRALAQASAAAASSALSDLPASFSMTDYHNMLADVRVENLKQ